MPASPRIVVVGLGPGDPALRTHGAQHAFDAAAVVILRTRVHPGLDDLIDDPRVIDCDDLYQEGTDFESLYDAVAERVLETARRSSGMVVFAVPGHPRFAERSVRLIEERAAADGIATEVQAGVSALDVIASALRIDPFAEGLQVVDALELAAAGEAEPFAGGMAAVDPARPCLIGQVYAGHVAAAVKLALGRFYPDEHPVTLVQAAGVPGQERVWSCPLHALDRQPVDHLTSLFLPALPPLEAVRSPLALQRVVARLRAPGGCPWDRAQTHDSLRGAVIEEAYEALDAIDAGDPANLAEELGDLLLQAALHAQIAEEAGDFSLEDVYAETTRKLLRRHPHVFGDASARTPEEVVTTWEAVKAVEREAQGRNDGGAGSAVDRLPRSMPALRRVVELLGPRLGAGLRAGGTGGAAAVEAGDALLAAAEATITAGIDPERALDDALRRRFDAAAPPVAAAPPAD